MRSASRAMKPVTRSRRGLGVMGLRTNIEHMPGARQQVCAGGAGRWGERASSPRPRRGRGDLEPYPSFSPIALGVGLPLRHALPTLEVMMPEPRPLGHLALAAGKVAHYF